MPRKPVRRTRQWPLSSSCRSTPRESPATTSPWRLVPTHRKPRHACRERSAFHDRFAGPRQCVGRKISSQYQILFSGSCFLERRDVAHFPSLFVFSRRGPTGIPPGQCSAVRTPIPHRREPELGACGPDDDARVSNGADSDGTLCRGRRTARCSRTRSLATLFTGAAKGRYQVVT